MTIIIIEFDAGTSFRCVCVCVGLAQGGVKVFSVNDSGVNFDAILRVERRAAEACAAG